MPLSQEEALKKVPEEIQKSEFYFDIKSYDASQKLASQHKASFMFRPSYSSKNKGDFVVSTIGQPPMSPHSLIYYNKTKDGYHCPRYSLYFATLDALIKHYQKNYTGLSNKPVEEKPLDVAIIPDTSVADETPPKANPIKFEEKTLAKPEKQTRILDTQTDKTAIEQQLNAYHFAIHTHATRTDELLVTVRNKLTYDPTDMTYFKKTDETNRDAIYKIRNSDYVTTYQSDFAKLYAYLEEAVKQVVGFDFDETLTVGQVTFVKSIQDIAPSDPQNMRFETQTRAVLKSLSQKSNLILIIVSFNSEENISNCLKIWYPEGNDPFKGKIYDYNPLSTKAQCFKTAELHIFDSPISTPLSEKKEYGFNLIRGRIDKTDNRRVYLNLGYKNPFLDVVSCLLIDDRYDNLALCSKCGIDTLFVGARDNFHLMALNSKFNLGLELTLQTLDDSLKPKEASENKPLSTAAQVTGDAFTSWANPTPKDAPAQIVEASSQLSSSLLLKTPTLT